MPPRQLSEFDPNARVTHEHNSIDTFESSRFIGLGAMAMQCIESWSRVEMLMGRVFVHLFGGADSLAANIYLSLQTKGPKLAAVRAAANEKLQGDELRAFIAVHELYANGDGDRNAFAHGVFGISAQISGEAVVLVPSADAIRGTVDRSKAKVYTATDFRSIIRAHWRVGNLVSLLHDCICEEDAQKRAALFDRLVGEPEIQADLLRRGAREKKRRAE